MYILILYNFTLSRRRAYVCHTLVDTSFNLISEFFHLKLGGSRCLVLSMLPPRVQLWGPEEEGGGGGATGFLFSS